MKPKRSWTKQKAPVAAPITKSRGRKGKLSGTIIAVSSAAIVSIYTLGRTNTSAAFNQLTAEPPTAAAAASQANAQTPGGRAQPTAVGTASSGQQASAAAYKDGTFVGSGNSRHGGMQVTVVIKDGKITSANVTSCGTRYPCSDVNPLVRAAVSQQSVPANHVSGATDSSQAYRQGLTNALKQAKA